MPREKFSTLTEQMFYILLCLCRECCGVDIMDMVRNMTDGRVIIGPGTLYSLLDSFLDGRYIKFTRSEGRRRSYIITEAGRQLLQSEYNRLLAQAEDYRRYFSEEGQE